MVGGGVTVKTKLVDVVSPPPSVTVNVMVTVPFCPTTGVTVTVRAAPAPPKTILAEGTSVVLLDAPASDSAATGVKSSPTVKASAEVTAF